MEARKLEAARGLPRRATRRSCRHSNAYDDHVFEPTGGEPGTLWRAGLLYCVFCGAVYDPERKCFVRN